MPPRPKPVRKTAGRASPSKWVGWAQGNWAALVLSSCIGFLLEILELLKIPRFIKRMIFVNQSIKKKNMPINSHGVHFFILAE
jgi:hypothetical protein